MAQDPQCLSALGLEGLCRLQQGEIVNLKASVVALQQALIELMKGYVGALESGRDRIIDLGGQCDSVEVMEAGDPCLIKTKKVLESQKVDPRLWKRSEPM